MRLRKSDPSGSYWYLCDGVSPASPVLTDGHTSFTPGLSEFKGDGTGSRFYLPDAQGNSRGLLDGGQSVTDGYNWDAFGNSVSRLGSNPTAFAWNEASGYQSDGDGGLTLLGHRYYDRRTGRFISQDPAGDGDNWYAYCGNDPMDGSDPSGLLPQLVDGIEIGLPNLAAAPGSPYDYSQQFTLIGVYQVMRDKNGNQDLSKAPKFLFNMLEPNNVDYAHNARTGASFMRFVSHNYFANRSYAFRNAIALPVYYQEVHTNGPMDYKQLRHKPGLSYLFSPGTGMTTALDNFGNFNAGSLAASMGITLDTAIGGADLFHRIDHLTLEPDNPAGQVSEKAGWDWYVSNYGFH